MQSERPQFIVPAGVQLEAGPEGLSVRFAGDVVLDAPLGLHGLKLRRIESTGGDITVSIALDVEELSALQGKIHAKGDLRAARVVAGEVHVRGAFVGEAASARSLRFDGPVRCARLLASAGPLTLGAGGEISGELVAEAGDVVVGGALRAPSLRASGRVTLRGAAELGTIAAGGELLAQGELRADAIEAGQSIECLDKVEARVLRAETVRLMGPRSELKMVQARSLISLGAGRVTADVFIAPVVDLAPRASGRVTVIESHNELGPCAVSGKLRLSELASLIGDVDAFLAERGLSRLAEGEWAPPAAPRGEPLVLAEAFSAPLPAPLPARAAAPAEPIAAAPPAPQPPAPQPAPRAEETLEDILAAYPSAAGLAPPPAEAAAAGEDLEELGWWDEEPSAELEPAPDGAAATAATTEVAPDDDALSIDDLNLDDLNFDALSPAPAEAEAAPLAPAVEPPAPPATEAAADAAGGDEALEDWGLDAALLAGDEAWGELGEEPEPAPLGPEAAPAPAPVEDGLAADTLVGPLSGMGGLIAAAMSAAAPAGPDEAATGGVAVAPGGGAGDEPFTGELQLPDLGDISEMDEETLLRKLIESPIPGLTPPAARAPAPTPTPLPADPQLEADFAAAAFSFDPADEASPEPEGEGAESGDDEATASGVAAVEPLPPGSPLTDAPSLAFISKAALLGAEPRDEERLFEVNAEDLHRASELSTEEVAQQLGQGPGDLPRAAAGDDEPAPMGLPGAVIEDVPVRRPLGPQPSGMGQLMLIEEPTAAAAPVAVTPALAAAPVEEEEEKGAEEEGVEAPAPPPAPAPALSPPRPSLSPVSAPMLPQPPAAPAAAPPAPALPAAAPALAPPRAAPAPAQDGPPNPVLALMLETMSRIRKAYGDTPPPPPLDHIDGLLASRDYGRIRDEFQGEVTALMDHHRKSGTPLSPKVSHQLRIIDTLVHNL